MQGSRVRLTYGCAIAIAASWSAAQAVPADAQAFDRFGARRTAAEIMSVSADFCAAYGAGFVQLQGTNTCVRIGGHLRVGATSDGSEQIEWATGSFVAVPANPESAPSHVRLDSGYDGTGRR